MNELATLALALGITHAALSHPDYTVRERCRGGALTPLLTRSGDPEVAMRAVREAEGQRDWIEAYLGDVDSLPWITALPVDWPDREKVIIKYMALARSDHKTWEKTGQWWHEREATRLLLMGLPRQEAKKLLPRMPYGMWFTRTQYSENEQGIAENYTEDMAARSWCMTVWSINDWGDPELFVVEIPKHLWPR